MNNLNARTNQTRKRLFTRDGISTYKRINESHNHDFHILKQKKTMSLFAHTSESLQKQFADIYKDFFAQHDYVIRQPTSRFMNLKNKILRQ
jgi:hypothetical protein